MKSVKTLGSAHIGHLECEPGAATSNMPPSRLKASLARGAGDVGTAIQHACKLDGYSTWDNGPQDIRR